MIVNGKIKGNVRCVERLELQAKAEIMGDVTYKVLEIAAGAQVVGNLTRIGDKAEVVKLRGVDAKRPEGE